MKTTTNNRLSNKTIVLSLIAFGTILTATGFPPIGLPIVLGLTWLASLIYTNSHETEAA